LQLYLSKTRQAAFSADLQQSLSRTVSPTARQQGKFLSYYFRGTRTAFPPVLFLLASLRLNEESFIASSSIARAVRAIRSARFLIVYAKFYAYAILRNFISQNIPFAFHSSLNISNISK